MQKLQAGKMTSEEIFLPIHFTGSANLPNVNRDDEPPGLPDLHKRVQKALLAHGMTQRLEVIVENDDGAVVLRGTVTTYYAKQMAQEVIRSVLKAHTPRPMLRNLIDVVQ